jgi:predicted dehydrogenase
MNLAAGGMTYIMSNMNTNSEKNDKRVLRWGIIGCGDVTEVKSGPAYQQTEGFELVAVCRRDGEKARDYAQRHGVPKYTTDANQLIADDEVDAVYIATPPDSHLEYALKVAEAGKPCCVEKPMAPNFADCEKISTAFATKNLPLFVAYYRRALPRFTKIKQWLDEERIGEIRHVCWEYSSPASATDLSGAYNWRTDASIAPGGYFDDIGCHGLDLIQFFAGDFKEASGFSVNQQGLYSAKDAITGCWTQESGATGSGSWNFGCPAERDRVEILGTKGVIEFSVLADNPIRLTADGVSEELIIEHPKHVQLPHVQAMRDDLFGEQPYSATGVSAARIGWVMDKILGTI